jgi:nitrogen fixation protein NifU and related proteins
MSYNNSELYQQVILDHNRKPRNFRKIENATHSCHGINPLCGDDVYVYLNVNDAGVIEDVSFEGSGCAISKASCSLMTTHLKGKTVEDARINFKEFQNMIIGTMDPDKEEHHLGKLSLFMGVREYPSRTKCASLAWHTMVGALDRKFEGISTE